MQQQINATVGEISCCGHKSKGKKLTIADIKKNGGNYVDYEHDHKEMRYIVNETQCFVFDTPGFNHSRFVSSNACK